MFNPKEWSKNAKVFSFIHSFIIFIHQPWVTSKLILAGFFVTNQPGEIKTRQTNQQTKISQER